MTKIRSKKFFLYIFPLIRIFIYITFFTIFFALKDTYLNKESICLTYRTFKIICPTCGVTRSFLSLLNGDFITAFKYNQLFLLTIFPIFLTIIIDDIIIFSLRLLKKTNKFSLLETLFTKGLK